jgi:tripartite-type tricarboxylate transporter receptor subunit TctC
MGPQLHRRFQWGLTLAAMIGVAHDAVAADRGELDYPSRPIRLLVAQSPGGNADIVGRAFAARMSERLGQQIVIDNRPGASGIIATETTVRATPDGYTILLVPSSFGVNPSVRKLPYDQLRDLTLITLLAAAPNVLVVNPSLPIRTVPDLVAMARAKPGQLRFGSSGNLGSPHLAGELFKTMANVDMTHVPYKAASAALIDVVSGQIELSFASMPSALGLARAGKLRSIAVTSLKRSAAVPELPTIAELGYAGFETAAWQGLLGPAKMPDPTLRRLNAEAARAARDPELKQRLLADGAETVGNSPEEFREWATREIAKWAKVVKAIGVKVD